jgi:hypothetical protein
MPHKFKTGQAVALIRTLFGPREVYETVRLMPPNEAGGPQYRLRTIATGAERVAAERDLRPA